MLIDSLHSIVEFASTEDAQRAIRELSEQLLLGRPVFIREVSQTNHLSTLLLTHRRIVNTSPGSAQRLYRARSVWPWRGKGCTLLLHLAHHPTTTSTTKTLGTSSMSAT